MVHFVDLTFLIGKRNVENDSRFCLANNINKRSHIQGEISSLSQYDFLH